jgi:hypothetical protein
MSARRAAAVVALLAVAVVAWVACSADRTTDAPPATEPSVPRAATAKDAGAAPRTVPRRRSSDASDSGEESAGNVIRGRTVLRDGSPAAGARVRAYSVARLRSGEDAEIGGERVTGDDGSFTFGGAEIGDQVVCYAVLAGHHTAHPPSTVKVESPVTDVTIEFGRGGVLTGRVVGPMGKPAGRVEVRLRPTDRLAHTRHSGDWRLWTERGIWEFYAATTTTDVGGLYRFDGVPLPRNGVLQTRVAIATIDGKNWASEDVAFETDEQEIERDIVIGEKEWSDTPLPEPEQPVKAMRHVTGRVVAPDGKPLAGATVTWLDIGGPGDVSWFGMTTLDDGSFAFEERQVEPSHRLEVRARAAGFRTFRGTAPDEGAMEIRLAPSDHAPLPGRIRGTARTSDDKAFTGPVEVTVVDEMYRAHGLWTWADANGAFVLEGVAPGDCQVFLSWSDAWQSANVPEGGEVRVELRSSRPAESFRPAPWTEEKAKRRDALARKIEQDELFRSEIPPKDPATGSAALPSDEGLEQLRKDLAELDECRLAALPVREVLVTGLPKDAGCVVVATGGSREWRSEAKGGVARFAGLSVEKWTLTLARPGRSDVMQEAEVAAGEGAQTIEFAVR